MRPTLIYLEADPGGQPGTDIEVPPNMPSCISKGRFVRVRISILPSKIISGHLEAAGGWPDTDIEVPPNMPSCISKGRFVRVRISIHASKIISGHLEVAGGWPGTDIEITL